MGFILLCKTMLLTGYTDTDRLGCPNTRHSTSGFVVLLGNNLCLLVVSQTVYFLMTYWTCELFNSWTSWTYFLHVVLLTNSVTNSCDLCNVMYEYFYLYEMERTSMCGDLKPYRWTMKREDVRVHLWHCCWFMWSVVDICGAATLLIGVWLSLILTKRHVKSWINFLFTLVVFEVIQSLYMS